MNAIRRTLLTAIAIGLLSTAAFGVEYMVSGLGQGTSSDQASADSQAQQQATNAVNSNCIGYTENVEFTSDNCITLGNSDNPSYVCMVTAKAECRVPTRNGR